MDGIILVHKPRDITSHDVVERIREILGLNKVGHFGTLDPLATGLLMIAVGKATRLFPYFSKLDKAYTGCIKLGFATNTYDAEGKATTPVSEDYPSRKKILKAMIQLTGDIDQVPPIYSAKKHRGRRLYSLARENKSVVIKPSRVNIQTFELLDYNPPLLDFLVVCSSGTYIRSLAHDLGQELGCGAHLSELERIKMGQFTKEMSHRLDEIETLAHGKKTEKFLLAMEAVLTEFPKIILTEPGKILAKNGNWISAENIQTIIPQDELVTGFSNKERIYRLFSTEGKLIALAKKSPMKPGLHPYLVIDTEVSDK